MEIVIQYEDQDGRVLSDPFMKLPSRKELPDYYEVIRKPVDITKILTKIEDGKYEDMDAVERDFMMLCSNTQKYNEDGSLIHEDSIVLQSVFTNAREKLSNEWNDNEDEEMDEESNQGGPSGSASAAPSVKAPSDSEDVSLASMPSTTTSTSKSGSAKKKRKEKEKEPSSEKKSRGRGSKRKKKYEESEDEEDDDY